MNNRVRVAGTLLAACLAVSAAGCVARAAKGYSSGQWTQFRLRDDHDATLSGSMRVRWRVQTHGSFSSSAAIAGSTLFIGNNAGDLYALDVASGALRWKFHTVSPLMSNPLLYDGLVVVGEGDKMFYPGDAKHPIMVGEGENALIALQASNGMERWRIKLAGSGMPTPAIVNRQLVQHNGAGEILVVDPESGDLLRKIDARGEASMSSIVPLGGDRFATSASYSNVVTAIDAHDGSTLWEAPISDRASGIGDCPLSSDAQALYCDYVAPMDDQSTRVGRPAAERIYSVDRNSGLFRWDVALESGVLGPWNEASIPLLDRQTLFVGSAVAPYMHALDARTGKLLWRVRVHGAVKGGLAKKDGTVYFGDVGGYLWALDAKSGRVVGVKNFRTPFGVASPVIDGQTLIVGTKTGALVAIPLDDIRASRDGAIPLPLD